MGLAGARFWIWKRALPDWTAISMREVVGAVYDRAFLVGRRTCCIRAYCQVALLKRRNARS